MPISPSFCVSMSMWSKRAPDERQLAAGNGERGEERGGLDAIGNRRVLDRCELLDTFDGDRRRPGADDLRAHAVEERREVGDLGLAGRVVDDGGALGAHRRHQDVLGRTDARELEQDPRAHQLPGVAVDEPVARREGGAEVLQPAHVEIDRARTEVVAAGKRDARLAAASEQRARAPRSRPGCVRPARRAPRARSRRARRWSDTLPLWSTATRHGLEQFAHVLRRR